MFFAVLLRTYPPVGCRLRRNPLTAENPKFFRKFRKELNIRIILLRALRKSLRNLRLNILFETPFPQITSYR